RHAARRRSAELSTVATDRRSGRRSAFVLCFSESQIKSDGRSIGTGRWAVSGAPESAWSARSRRSQTGWRSPEVYSEPSSRDARARGRWQAQIERALPAFGFMTVSEPCLQARSWFDL